jgi:methylated-DNA-[protein]-cysteine S-methyltransferase
METHARQDYATAAIETPLGRMTLAATAAGLTHALFEGSPKAPPASGAGGDPRARRHVEAAARALADYYAGRRAALGDLVLAPAGTPFQRRVWAALREIPHGTTTTYGRLAARVGRPRGARAVGLANNRNPLAIVVPCHRVVGADGTLTGYAGGLDKKAWLLAHEGAEAGAPTPGAAATAGATRPRPAGGRDGAARPRAGAPPR